MARTRYGKTFRTRRGKFGRYKYIRGRRVSFVEVKGKRYVATRYPRVNKGWRFKRVPKYRRRY